jgi:thiamine-monophosphate kinase
VDEFLVIRKYFERKSSSDTVEVGIGDDCAVLIPPIGQRLVSSIDTQIAGRHFPKDTPAEIISSRALHCAVSDLAAMGAETLWFSLALSMPEVDEAWLDKFSEGLFSAAQECAIGLIGGDTTKGPLSVTVHVQGAVPEQRVLLRSGAKVGDQIFVSGSLGDAAAGLALVQNQFETDNYSSTYLRERFYAPKARVKLGLLLRYIATSCIDISDGLLSDLGHICHASGVGAVLDATKLPLSQALLASTSTRQALEWALTGGDDYQLCFTVPEAHAESLLEKAKTQSMDITRVGEMVSGSGVIDAGTGKAFKYTQSGYTHF